MVQKAEGLLKVVLGPPAKEFGQLWKDRVSARRFRNLVKIAMEAKEQLSRAGLSPREVPLRIIHPLLEDASLEEDTDLQKRWASLLANASAGNSGSQVLPCYVDILRQLTPVEARFLDKAYNETIEPRQHQPANLPPPRRHPVLENTLALLRPSTVGNLERLGLITRHSHEIDSFTSYLGRNTMGATNHLYIADLGMDFVRACRPPAGHPAKVQ
jgi:hypothetical protein